jgi:spore coat polysaccharide biosynthesis protein SpsF
MIKKIGITIEARMSSSRLPGKTLKLLTGKPMLERMIERLKRVKMADQIIIATTVNPADEPIVELAKKLDVGYYRGSENDVLDRVLQAANKYDIDLIVETCGDCPVIDPLLLDLEIATFLNNDFDYVGCHLNKTWPIGIDAKLFTTKTLEHVATKTNDPADRENVSLYIYEHPDEFIVHNIEANGRRRRPDLRLVVDHQEDFDLMEIIYEKMDRLKKEFDYSDLLDLFENNLELVNINKDVINIAVAGRDNNVK